MIPLSQRERGEPARIAGGRVRGYAACRVGVSVLTVPNPSSSHACGAGPSFSLWEKDS